MTVGPRILVVGDAGAVRDLLRDALGHAVFEVDTASTATEAVDQLAARRYAVRPSTGWPRCEARPGHAADPLLRDAWGNCGGLMKWPIHSRPAARHVVQN